MSGVTPDAVRALAAMVRLPLTEAELLELTQQMAAGAAGLAALWAVDVSDSEPFAIFPVDRS